MSEVTGPPQPKGLKPVIRVPEIRKREQKPDDQKPPHQQGQAAAKQSSKTQHLSRDPAVSLSASMGQIEIGAHIAGSIATIDEDGRPILITDEATFSLTPNVGLKQGDTITLNIVTTDHKLKAELTIRNGNPEDPPVTLTLTLVSVKHADQSVQAAPNADARYIDRQTGAYIPPTNAPAIISPLPQTSLSSGIYQPSTITDTPSTAAVHEGRAPQPSERQNLSADKVTAETRQPADPTTIHASASDMATLLAAQQVAAPQPAPTLQPDKSLPKPPAPITPTPVTPASNNSQKTTVTHTSAVTAPQNEDKTKAVTASQAATGISKVPNGSKTQPAELPAEPGDKKAQATQDTAVAYSGLKQKVITPSETSNPPLSQKHTVDSDRIATQQAEQPIPDSRRAMIDAPPTPASHSMIVAKFIPSDSAQAILSKANISSFQKEETVGVLLRPKYRTDPAHAIEVKILSVHHKTAVHIPENSPDALKTMERSESETNKPPMSLHIETTGGSVELQRPSSAPLPQPDSAMVIIPSQTLQTPPPQLQQAKMEQTLPLSLLSIGLKKWPALQKTHELVNQEQMHKTMPAPFVQQLHQAVDSRTAGGGARLINSLLFIMSALKQGDASSWLGPKIENYLNHTGQKPLLSMLKQDVMRFARLLNRPASGEWQPIVLPLAADDNSPLIALLIRPEHPDEDAHDANMTDTDDSEEPEETPVRFILEVDFSKMGNIQLDGFIKERHFDLNFKSLVPLRDSMKNDIRRLFSNAIDANGYQGSITFHHLTKFPVDVASIINEAAPLDHEMHNV